jgi:asparagine synthase (glutamine-hydrolysing)
MLRAEETRGKLKTFSVGYAEETTQADDELAFARLAADTLGTEHHQVRVSVQAAVDALPKIVWHLDEPVADPACVPLYFLARRAGEQVTVVLSGEGADEAFGGYYIYRRLAGLEALRRRLGFASSAMALIGKLGAQAPSAKLQRTARLLSGPLETTYRGVSRALDDQLAAQLHHNVVHTPTEVVRALLAPYWDATRSMTPLRRMLYLDSCVWLPDDLLVKADKMTMAHAVELRVPFLDHELMEHAWSLPDALKVTRGHGKALLRRAARGRVPQAILDRPKKGFATPTATWLRDGMHELLRAALTDRASLARQRFDRRLVTTMIERHRSGADLSAELWPLLILELWHQNYAGTSRPSAARAQEVA